ncbi:MAG: acyl-CoA dehydrogenase family protein [Myxococcota bacterium]|nr:acyl-CoA dehydrogenase family protein [Myxococcota bacterium]
MNLDFSEEQEMLRDMVRTLCAEHATVELVRAMEDDPTGYPSEFWKQLAEVEILGILIPEEFGGSGMTMLDAAVVYEEFGRSLAPSPHFVSCVLAAGAILEGGTDDQKKEWLPQIASGDAIVSPAWLEPHNGYGPKGVQLRAQADGDDFVLSGTKLHCLFASSAARLLVLARTGEAATDVDLFLVDPQAQGVGLEQQMSLASDTQYQVNLDGVRLPATSRLGEAGSGWAVWNKVMHDGIILASAQAMGGAQRSLEITCEYASEREQFDKPLAAFQSISHYLADAATQVSGGTTLVYEAAWARSEGKPIAQLAPMAKLFACQTYRDLTAMSLQVFGGVGFTVEYDAQLFFRRAKQLQLSWWDTPYLEELVAASILD